MVLGDVAPPDYIKWELVWEWIVSVPCIFCFILQYMGCKIYILLYMGWWKAPELDTSSGAFHQH